ncbi:MAG: hypothetical protein QXO86_07440 [Nitrososphaerota archaeon]
MNTPKEVSLSQAEKSILDRLAAKVVQATLYTAVEESVANALSAIARDESKVYFTDVDQLQPQPEVSEDVIMLPAEITKDIIVTYAPLIEKRLVKKIREGRCDLYDIDVDSCGDSYSSNSISTYTIVYAASVYKSHLIAALQQGLSTAELLVRITIRSYVVKYQSANIKIGGSATIMDDMIYLYSTRYPLSMLQKADKIVQDIAMYARVAKRGKRQGNRKKEE